MVGHVEKMSEIIAQLVDAVAGADSDEIDSESAVVCDDWILEAEVERCVDVFFRAP